MKKYIGLLLLFCTTVLTGSFSQTPPADKSQPVLEQHFSYFVHGVAQDSTLKVWQVQHTGQISKQVTLTAQNLTIKDDGDSQITYPVSNLQKYKKGYVWLVMEREKRVEIWQYCDKCKILRRGFKTSAGKFHQIRYYPKEQMIPLNSKFT